MATKAKAPKAIKKGDRVKVTRRDGSISKGIVKDVFGTLTGNFISVDIGSKEVPHRKSFRPAAVKAY